MKMHAHGLWMILFAALALFLVNQPALAQVEPSQSSDTTVTAAPEHESGQTLRTFRRVAFIATAALAGGLASELFFDIGGLYGAVMATAAAIFGDWYIKEGFWPFSEDPYR